MSSTRRALRRGLATLGAATLLAPLLGVPLAGPAAAATVPTVVPAEAGAGYLMRLFGDNGYLAGFDGTTPDYGVTADAVLSLVAVGTGRTQVERALTFLEGGLDGDYAQDAQGRDLPGRLGKLLMAFEAAGQSRPELVARIAATLDANGRYSQPTENGPSKQVLAMLGLEAADVAPPAGAISWLLGQQCSDGGWQINERALDVACTDSDTNTTSYAIMALMGAVDQGADVAEESIVRALDFLDGAQRTDGGLPYSTRPFTPGGPVTSDANSTALAIEAVLAAGEDPTAGDWVASGGDLVDALFRLQAGCGAAADKRGGFRYDANAADPDYFTTAQAVVAAAGEWLPVLPVASTAELSADEPVLDCLTLSVESLSIAVNVGTITLGNRPTLSGVARNAAGAAVSGATVQVVAREYGATDWRIVGEASTGSDGRWQLVVAPTKQTSYVAVAGDAESAGQLVYVAQRMTITAPAAGSTVPARTTVTGSVLPAGTGTAVGVAAVINGRYRFLATGRTTGQSFAIPVSLPRGTYALVVYTSARNGLLKGARSVTVTVR